MESYIVRIYRRTEQEKLPVRGLVEKVGAVGQDAFGTKEELWNILSSAKKTGKRGTKSDDRTRKGNKKQASTE